MPRLTERIGAHKVHPMYMTMGLLSSIRLQNLKKLNSVFSTSNHKKKNGYENNREESEVLKIDSTLIQ